MTEELFREDAYLKNCEATVTAVDGNVVHTDRTIFYPLGGGQPGDTGILRWEGGSAAVSDTRYVNGDIGHIIDGDAPPVGATVQLDIDWDRRYRHMRMHTASVCAARLHDSIEDTLATREDVIELFGEEITFLVEGVTKLSKVEYSKKEERQAENFRKMLVAMAEDPADESPVAVALGSVLFGSAFTGFGFSPGAGVRAIDTPLGRAVPLICYEAIFPRDLRAAPGRAELAVYDLRGVRVRTLATGTLGAGAHARRWDAMALKPSASAPATFPCPAPPHWSKRIPPPDRAISSCIPTAPVQTI